MKRNIVRTILFVATLLLSLAAVASAQEWPGQDALRRSGPPTCTMAGRAGEYGFTWTGTFFPVPPSGAVLASAVGISTFDDAGNTWGTQTVNRGGTVSQRTFNGTYTVNPDCTGTIAVSVYDLSGNLIGNVTWATVSVNNMTETHNIMTSYVLADGTNVPVVITLDAKKLFPYRRK
jgi:hypothetical protein